jgi:membrane associated rhomboid family serine protease
MSIIEDIKQQYKNGGMLNRLIFWNIGCFVISLIFFWKFSQTRFDYPEWLALSSEPTTALVFPWTLITYAFLHSGFLHLLFNMLILNFTGRLFLTFFTERQLLGLYILSALFAGLVFVGMFNLLGYSGTVVGASGAVIAILLATTTYRPTMQVRLLLLGTVRLWHITGVLFIIELMQPLLMNTGGHLAHLGGAIFGFIFMKLLMNGTDMSLWVNKLTDFIGSIFKPSKKTPFKKVHKNYNTVPKSTTSRIVTKDKVQQQIDDILDKISQSGYDSLTSEEKEFLFKAGK